MKQACILGIDLGTSAMKAVAYDRHFQAIAEARLNYCPEGGHPDADDWWSAFLGALEVLRQQMPLDALECLSFAGYNAMVGVDQDLNPTTPVIAYFDSGPLSLVEKSMGAQDAAMIFEMTGNRLFANGMMASAMLWIRDHLNLDAKTDCYLYSNGFLAARLTGRLAMEGTRASLSLLHDPRRTELCWEPDLCRFFGIDCGKLPDILNPWDIAGTITEAAARLTGLKQGLPVVIGGMDSMCAALGNGNIQAGDLIDIGGSAGGMSVITRTPIANDRLYLVRYVLPGLWAHIGPLGASSRLFKWFISQYAPGWTLDEFNRQVQASPPFAHGVQFLPYIGGTRHPYWKSAMCGHFLNLSMEASLPDLARAVMEGLGCAYRSILNDFHALGIQPTAAVPAGGDSRSPLWMQIKANYLQIPYVYCQPPLEGSARGAAMVGAYGIGLVRDFTTFFQENPRQVARIEPDAALAAACEGHYRQFVRLCSLLYETD